MFYRLRRIRKAFQIKLHTEFLYQHNLQELPVMGSPAGLTIRMLQAEEIPLLQTIWNVNPDQLAQRFERGDICYGGFINEKICSYHWVQYSGRHFFQQAHQLIEVTPGEGWIYHVRVADWAKGRGINGFVYTRILSDAKNNGKSRLFIYTGSTNTSNQKGLAKCGFRKISEFFSIWFWHRYFLIRERLDA